MAKMRLDQAMVARGLADSIDSARRQVMAGEVRVDGQLAVKPDRKLSTEERIEVEPGAPFVSRGGLKLAAAIDAFPVKIEGRTCADVGASTGGFTDCLLQRGAARVYAIDAGHGQLDWGLRQDPRVRVMERTNARKLAALPEPIGLAVVDVSFISLRLIIPTMTGWLAPDADVIALVKPQFEAQPSEVESGGVVRDPAVRRRVVASVVGWFADSGLRPRAGLRSPLDGPKGNAEYLIWTSRVGSARARAEILADIGVDGFS
jgi:23S rRNA (cytidine1920-2'-O)/16S rRNA (cytidine1409-2'-O)-methyltransferase